MYLIAELFIGFEVLAAELPGASFPEYTQPDGRGVVAHARSSCSHARR